MKKITLAFSLVVLSVSTLIGQPGFSYQAVLRHADGSLRANELVVLNVEMIQNLIPVYTETQSVNTNDYGVFSIVVGEGAGEETYTSSIFMNNDSTQITDTYLRISESGGNLLSETKILGVPIAEVAKVALNVRVTLPVGAVVPFAGNADKIPDGWLLCDGEPYDIAIYPELFGVIGESWGTTGPDRFRVPDLRGVFLRGVSGGAADEFSDPDTSARISRHEGGNIGNATGSYQTDNFESHSHTSKATFIINGSANRYSGGSWGAFSEDPAINNTGGNETRPVNAYVNYIIKY